MNCSQFIRLHPSGVDFAGPFLAVGCDLDFVDFFYRFQLNGSGYAPQEEIFTNRTLRKDAHQDRTAFADSYVRNLFYKPSAHADDDCNDYAVSTMIAMYTAGLMTAVTFRVLYNRFSTRVMNAIVNKIEVVNRVNNIEAFVSDLFGMISQAMTVYSVAHFASKCWTVLDYSCLFSLLLKTKFGESISEAFLNAFARAHGESDYLKDIVTVFITFISVFITGFVDNSFVANFFRWIGITGLSDKMKASANNLSYFISYYVLKFIVWATVDGNALAARMMSEFDADERKKSILKEKPELLRLMLEMNTRFSSGFYDRPTAEQLESVGSVLVRVSRLLQVIASSKNMSVPEYNLIKSDFTTLSVSYKKKRVEISSLHRIEPTVLYLCGPAGTGKSTLMDHVRDKLVQLEYSNYEETGGAVYSRDASSKHWNGYRNHPIVTIDDIFQNQAKENTEEAKQVIQVVSCNPYHCEMAAIVDKDTMFTSEVIILTSNSTKPDILNDRDALTRRLAQNFVYVQKCRNGFSGVCNDMLLYRWKNIGKPINYPKVTHTHPLFPESEGDQCDRWFTENFEKVTIPVLISDMIKSVQQRRIRQHGTKTYEPDDIEAHGDDTDTDWSESDNDTCACRFDFVNGKTVCTRVCVYHDAPGLRPILKEVTPSTGVYNGFGNPVPAELINSTSTVFTSTCFDPNSPFAEADAITVPSPLSKIDADDLFTVGDMIPGPKKILMEASSLLQRASDMRDNHHFKHLNKILMAYPKLNDPDTREFISTVQDMAPNDREALLTRPQNLSDPRFQSFEKIYLAASAITGTRSIDVVVNPLRIVVGMNAYHNVDDIPIRERSLVVSYLRGKIHKNLASRDLRFSVGSDGFPCRIWSQAAVCIANGTVYGYSNDLVFHCIADDLKLVNSVISAKLSISEKLYQYVFAAQALCLDFVRRIKNNWMVFSLALAAIVVVVGVVANFIVRAIWSRVSGAFARGKKEEISWGDLVEKALQSGELVDDMPIEYGATHPGSTHVQNKKVSSDQLKGNKINRNKYNFHNRSGRAHGGEEVLETSVSEGSRLIDVLCSHMVRLQFHSDQGWSVRLNGLAVGGGSVLVPRHLLSTASEQSQFRFNVMCDEKKFEETVPRSSIRFPTDVRLADSNLKDFCIVNFRDLTTRKNILNHIAHDTMSFGMFSRKKPAVILRPSFKADMPRVSYACPTTDVTGLVTYDYSDDRSTYRSTLYKIANLSVLNRLISGDCGSLLISEENGAMRICGFYVAGSPDSNYFQPLIRSDIEKLSVFETKCKGYQEMPPVTEFGAEPLVQYPTPCKGIYARDCYMLRSLPKTSIEPSQVQVECSDLFGHEALSAPADLSLEAAQKAVTKKYHEGGTLDLTSIEIAKDWIESLYRPYIKDCHCGSVEDGVTGATAYGTLEGLELSTSPGIPWKTFIPDDKRGTPAYKGKKWLFDSEMMLKKPVYDVCQSVVDSWRDGYAFPSIFFGSLKDERRPLDRVAAKKTRIFTAAPVEKVICDRALFGDFIVQFKSSRLNLMHCYGIDAGSLEWNDMAYMHKKMGSSHAAADYSGYDASLTAQLLCHAYELVARFYPKLSDKLAIDCSSVESRNHFVYMFGGLWQCIQGNPSGQTMTTVINSVVNHLLLSYAWIRHFTTLGRNDLLDYSAWRKNFVCHVYGDDFIYTVSETAKSFSCVAYDSILRETGQELTDPGKKDNIRAFIPWNELSLLKRCFLVNPFSGSKKIYVGALEKEVIEEIPRWTHKGSDDEAFSNTLRSTLSLAALWGREYFDTIVAGLAKSQSANEILGSLCPAQIFREIAAPYVSNQEDVIQPIAVRAFFMGDNETCEDDRFLSNLCAHYKFNYVVDGKTISVSSSEKAYGLEKSMHFGDQKAFAAILRMDKPGLIARETHRVGNGSDPSEVTLRNEWISIRESVMEKILKCKFQQPQYAHALRATDTAFLVEASSRDLYWGSGLNVVQSRITPPARYPGKNILGRLLMKIRATL